MAQICRVCSNPQVANIEKALMAKQSYAKIGNDFEISWQSVRKHAKNHLKPIIDKANAAAEKRIVNKILKYREEVNYSPLDKSKYAQSKLLNEFDKAKKLDDRLNVLREFRGWFQEENKIAGNYKKEGENPDTISQTAAAITAYLQANPDFDENDRAEIIKLWANTVNLDVKQVSDLVN